MQEIESLARKHALEYFRLRDTGGDDGGDIRDRCEGNIEFEKIMETYKLLIVPEKTLQTHLFSLGKDNAKKEFRRMALLVHPDKNSHPNSKIAFQKLYNHFIQGVADTN